MSSSHVIKEAWNGFWNLTSVPKFLIPSKDDNKPQEGDSSAQIQVYIIGQSSLENPDAPELTRKNPLRLHIITGHFCLCGVMYLFRGTLSDSLLLMEGGSLYRIVFVDEQHQIQAPELNPDGCVEVARTCTSHKPVHIPVGEANLLSCPCYAEEFVSPITLQLVDSDSRFNTIRCNFDWKRLFHGAGTCRSELEKITAPPKLYCIRVSVHPSVEVPAVDPIVSVTRTATSEGSTVSSSPVLEGKDQQPHTWRSILPHSNVSLSLAAAVCSGLAKQSPVVGTMAQVHLSCIPPDASNGEPSSSMFIQSAVFPDAQLIPANVFDINVVQAHYAAYWHQAPCVAIGVPVEELKKKDGKKEEVDTLSTLLPVSDSILAQLNLAHVRYHLVDVLIVSRGSASRHCDEPLTLSSQQSSTAGGNYCCFATLSGEYSSIAMARLNISKSLVAGSA